LFEQQDNPSKRLDWTKAIRTTLSNRLITLIVTLKVGYAKCFINKVMAQY